VNTVVNTIKRILTRPLSRNATDPRANQSDSTSTNGNDPTNFLLGLLQRPWKRVTKFDEPETVFVMVRRNYKVYANLGITRRQTRRYSVILDTGAGSSFIRKDVLHERAWKLIRPDPSPLTTTDANNRQIQPLGIISLAVDIGGRVEVINFKVVERLAVPVILGCDYCDKHVEAIKRRQRIVELDDGTIVPIIRKPPARPQGAIPLPEQQLFIPKRRRRSTKIQTTGKTILKPESHDWVEVVTDKEGLVIIEPFHKLYERHECLAGTGVYQATPGKPFNIMIANFAKHPFVLTSNQTVAHCDDHTTALAESDMSHAELFGIVEDDTKYRKRDFNAKDVNLINKHLEDARNAAVDQSDDTPITADNVELHVDKKYHPKIRKMLRKHEKIWEGRLGKITATTHRIDLIPGARPFKSAPYRAGPRNAS